MTAKRPVIGIIGHGTAGSVAYFFEAMERLLRPHFETLPLLRQEQGRLVHHDGTPSRVAWGHLVRVCDVLVGRTSTAMRYRDRLDADCAVVYLPLGELPLGPGYYARLCDRFRASDTIAFSCRSDRAIHKRIVARCAAKLAVLPWFVDTASLLPFPPAHRRRGRARHNIESQHIVFLYVGRVQADKNVHLLLRAFAHIHARHPHSRLWIVGPTVNHPTSFGRAAPDMGRVLEALVDGYGLRKCVTLFPPVDRSELPALFGSADVFVNLTVHATENFGLSQVEAASCGLPVVVTEWGGLKDVVVDGQTGYLVNTCVTSWGIHVDLGQVIEACDRLAACAAERRRLGDEGRRRAVRLYSLDAFSRRMCSIIADCLARRARPQRTRQKARLTSLGRTLSRRRTQFFTRRTYPVWRSVISPYAGAQRATAFSPRSRLFVPATALVFGHRWTRVVDPLWPARYELTADERRVLAFLNEASRKALRPWATYREVVAGAAVAAERTVVHALRRLLAHGMAMVSRPLRAAGVRVVARAGSVHRPVISNCHGSDVAARRSGRQDN